MKSVDAQNVNHPEYTEPLNSEKYGYVRSAILAAIAAADDAGMPFGDLEDAVDRFITDEGIPRSLFPKPGSVRWYTKAVQLDLEARDLIERVPGAKPLRFRQGVSYSGG